MISHVEYGVMGEGLLTLTIACETMTVEIICTPIEFRILQAQVEVEIWQKNSIKA